MAKEKNKQRLLTKSKSNKDKKNIDKPYIPRGRNANRFDGPNDFNDVIDAWIASNENNYTINGGMYDMTPEYLNDFLHRMDGDLYGIASYPPAMKREVQKLSPLPISISTDVAKNWSPTIEDSGIKPIEPIITEPDKKQQRQQAMTDLVQSDAWKASTGALQGLSTASGGEDQALRNSLGRNSDVGPSWAQVTSGVGMAAYDTINSIVNMTKKDRVPMTTKVGIYDFGGGLQKGMNIGESVGKLAANAIKEAQIADSSELEAGINKQDTRSFAGSNDDLMNQWRNTRLLSDTLTYKDFKDQNMAEAFLASIPASFEGFNAGSQLGSAGSIVGGIVGGISSLVGSGIGRHRAEKKARELNEEIRKANDRMASSFSNSVQNNALEQLEALELGNIGGVNNAANGGPLNMRYTGTMSPFGNRFDDGGALTNEFSNNVTTVNSGGTHEENPLEGVQMGIDPQGIPNLVEEGEVVFDDYVYSDRLKVPKTVRHKYKLRGITFADTAKDAQKESEERPNDPISKNYLDFIMPTLAQEQEQIRAKKLGSNNLQPNQMESINYAACGGRLSNKYDDGSYIVRYTDAEGKQQSSEVDGYYDGYADHYLFLEKNPHLKAVLNNGVQVKSGDMPMFDLADGYTWDEATKRAIKKTKSQDVIKDSPFRYAPIVGSGLAVLNDMLGGNEVDYSNINAAMRAIDNSYKPVSPGYLGSYLTFKPYDTQQALNNLNAQQAATRRNIINLSGGNRATAMAGLLASDYNYGNQVGDILAKAEEVNDARRGKVAEFNRATNKYNLESAFNASKFNSELAQRIGSQYPALYRQRQDLYDSNVAEKSANLTNFLNNLGNLGREKYDINKINWLAKKGVIKVGANGEIVVDEDALNKVNTGALGGSIKKRKKKGVTI